MLKSMLKRKEKLRRKGFTLVELLVVIVIIGILTAMTLLSSSEAINAARVARIIEGLRSVSVAAMIVYTDDTTKCDTLTSANEKLLGNDDTKTSLIDAMKPYLKNEEVLKALTNNNTGSAGTYSVLINNDGSWWAVYTLQSKEDNTGEINKRLKNRAKEMDLMKSSNQYTTDDPSKKNYYEGGNQVFMMIRS